MQLLPPCGFRSLMGQYNYSSVSKIKKKKSGAYIAHNDATDILVQQGGKNRGLALDEIVSLPGGRPTPHIRWPVFKFWLCFR